MKSPNLRDMRLTVKTFHVLKALKSCKWVSMTQLAAILTDDIPPECAIRFYLHRGNAYKIKRCVIDVEIALGYRRVISKVIGHSLSREYVKRKYVNGEPYYKLTRKGKKRHEEYEARRPEP